jgi:hypothetical protein
VPTGAVQRRCESQALFGAVAPDHLLQARLVDWNASALQCPDLGRVFVNANDVVAVLGQASACHETDVAAPDDRNLHPLAFLR